MTGAESLAELEARQDEERAGARARLEVADETFQRYRMEIHRIQEAFYEHAGRRGIGDDPGFRSGFHRVLETSDEQLRAGQRLIEEQADAFDAMAREHDDERERLLAERRQG